MVFEYLEYDLAGIIETKEIRITQDHIKSWTYQLLEGTHYIHINKIIHRDLKSSNILVNRRGELKIADWGLARSWNSEINRLTNRVITLWYRPPELLMGCVKYCSKIDMWSVGCIIAEMFRRCTLFKGHNEASQLKIIFKACGKPTVDEWPNIHQICPLWKHFEPKEGDKPLPSFLRETLMRKLPNSTTITSSAIVLVEKLVTLNPDSRWSAIDAIKNADYFYEKPSVKPAIELSMKLGINNVHEWEIVKKIKSR